MGSSKWVPPEGFSALPKEIRNKIPKEFKYWMMEEEKDRMAMRDALVNAIKEGKVRLQFQKSEELEKLSLSDARFVLQYHYFRNVEKNLSGKDPPPGIMT